MRGVAACWVMVYHTAYRLAAANPLDRLVRHGYLAVDLFFVLSGFVLAYAHGDGFAAGAGRGAYRRFLWRRFARLYPLYGAVTLAVAAMGGGPGGYRDLLGNLLLVQAWHTDLRGIVGPAWSVSCELLASLLFPGFCAAILFARPTRALGGVALAGLGLVLLAQVPDGWIAEAGLRGGPLDIWVGSSFGPMLRCLSEFAIGVGLCRFRRGWWGGVLAGASGWIGGAAAGLALAALGWPGTDLFAVAMFAALILALSWDRGALARLLGWGPIHFLGAISYAIYLLHVPMLGGLGRLMAALPGLAHGPPRAILAWIAILGAAALAHRLIEAPCRRWIGGLARVATGAGEQTSPSFVLARGGRGWHKPELDAPSVRAGPRRKLSSRIRVPNGRSLR